MSTPPPIFNGLEDPGLPTRPCHVAVGMFDGVHRGHQAVIEGAVEAARRSGALSAVLTFHPHPSRLFRPGDPTRLIFGVEDRRALLFRLGVDFLVEQPFTRGFAGIEAEALAARFKTALNGLDTLYVGGNWRFGRGRRGDVALLVETARREGVNVVSTDRLSFNGRPISSTRIRELLTGGDVAAAAELLGFPYFAGGVVVPGRQLGGRIGVPTLNLDWRPDLEPAFGVYAVRVGGSEGGVMREAIANWGVRPTVDGAGAPVLEVHVLGDCPFGRGDTLRVDWLARLREERRFGSVDELRAQIDSDREAARRFFAEARP